jgi:hypothetical protein
MIRFVLLIVILSFMGGCQIGSISEVGRFVVRDEMGAIVSSRRPHVEVADVLVVFADIQHEGETMSCPVAAMTVDDQCGDFNGRSSLDRVCRWTATSGKDAPLTRVRWKKAVAGGGGAADQFRIEFEGDSPCNGGPLEGTTLVTCVAKAGGLGLKPGEEKETPYDIEVDECPILDPYIIWRQ